MNMSLEVNYQLDDYNLNICCNQNQSMAINNEFKGCSEINTQNHLLSYLLYLASYLL